MRLFVLGATGRTGSEIVNLALTRGHQVTAFVRSPQKLSPAGSLAIVRGDPRDPQSMAAALPGHEAVLSAIGPPPREALRPSTLVTDCARATVAAMTASSVARLAIVSAAVLFPDKGFYFAFFRWLTKHHARDLRGMEAIVRASGLACVLLLRDVFDFGYDEIAALVGRSEPACRKLLERARENVATEKRLFAATPEVHHHLLTAFTQAPYEGDLDALVTMLADEALMITDGGAQGRRVGGIRNLPVPLHGARRIAAFVVATAGSVDLASEIHELNGQPALVLYDEDTPFAAVLLGVADGRIHRVFFHADLTRLRYLGPRTEAS
jgi:uncharacterized protein YbjT (DUF2867 family)